MMPYIHVNLAFLFRLVCAALAGAIVLWVALAAAPSTAIVGVAFCMIAVLLLAVYRVNYLHPSVVFLVPWMGVLILSAVPMSDYARPLATGTYFVLIGSFFAWLMASSGAPVTLVHHPGSAPEDELPVIGALRRSVPAALFLAFAGLYSLALLEIAVSGYVPIVELVTSGNSGYETFGIPSLHGAFYAFANALGCLSIYLFFATGRRTYLLLFLSVIGIHIALVTRGNMLTLLVQAFIIRCLMRGQVPRWKVALAAVVALTLFSIAGEFRSGDIKQLLSIKEEYSSLPAGIFWFYGYSYFNVLNLENTISYLPEPLFDGSMFHGLLPTVFRPEPALDVVKELPAMAVTSYIYPIYLDIGPVGVILTTALLGYITALFYRRAVRQRRFLDVSIYATLYYCALMSFFVNFWLFLPLMFQLFFFWAFDRYFFVVHSARLSPQSAVRQT